MTSRAALPRFSLCLVLLGACFGGSLACGDRSPGDRRPNVLLVTVDTLRADYLGAYGSRLGASPNIDQLAAEGVIFRRAVAASSATAPSHASIMTSLYVRENAIGFRNGDTKLREEQRLAEHFRAAGYATGAFVGNVVLRPEIGLDRGFEVYDDELPDAELNREVIFERIAERTNERALEWLSKVEGGPFFLWVHYQDPHGPYAPPLEYAGRVQISGPADEEALDVAPNPSGWNSLPDYQKLEGLDLPSQYMGRYADEILYMDAALGNLIAAVDGHTSRRPRIVLFTSDHGESMGESERYFTHGFSTTPQLAHVPMIVRAPGLPPGERSGVVSHVDILPTLLELAGLAPQAAASGIALGPYVRDQRSLPERLVYCDIGHELSAYRADSFTRFQGVGAAWRPEEDEIKPTFLSFEWKDDRGWELIEQDVGAAEQAREYYSEAVPMDGLPRMSRGELEVLRLLGYVQDEASP